MSHRRMPALHLARSAPTLFRAASAPGAGAVRRLHSRKELPYPVEDGLGDFLPPDALRAVAIDYQQGLLDRLNDEVRGTELHNKSIAQTLIDTALHRRYALAFNYASLALNNSFFLDNLRPPAAYPDPPLANEAGMSVDLRSAFRTNWLGLPAFKSAFSAAALGLASSGWIWLATNTTGHLVILPTHGAGTLLVRSRDQAAVAARNLVGTLDDAPPPDPTAGALGPPPDAGPARDAAVRAAHAQSRAFWRGLDTDGLPPLVAEFKAAKLAHREDEPAGEDAGPVAPTPTPRSAPPGVAPASPASGAPAPSSPPPPAGTRSFHHAPAARAESDLTAAPRSLFGSAPLAAAAPTNVVNVLTAAKPLFPILCVSVHEHAWMAAGLGVWGQEEWMRRFWTAVDWEKVSRAYDRYAQRRERY